MEATIPLFPCRSLSDTLTFYKLLGFEVTYRQEEPYLYAAVQRGDITLHFGKLTTWGSRNAVCLVFVPEVEAYHAAFADALRTHYGSVPTAGFPRITRWRRGQTRFHVFDPSGNVLLFINQYEPTQGYEWSENLTPMLQALENAVFLRDVYCNDDAAAKVLDKALARHSSANALERARALAARAELAVAMGDAARAHALQDELKQIPLSDDEQALYDGELRAADNLERWITWKQEHSTEA